MNRFFIFFKCFFNTSFILLLICCLAGCITGSPKSPQTFLLSSLQPSSYHEPLHFDDSHNLPQSLIGKKIGVGPVKIPEYLNRPQIISRSKGNEIFFEEFYLWAEPLKDSLSRVLAKNISQSLATDQVFIFPFLSGIKPDYRVIMEFFRFDGKLGGEVYLDVYWAVYFGESNFLVESKRSAFIEICRDIDHEALVAAHNLLLFNLSREIAGVVRSHSFPIQDQ